MIKYLHCKKNR